MFTVSSLFFTFSILGLSWPILWCEFYQSGFVFYKPGQSGLSSLNSGENTATICSLSPSSCLFCYISPSDGTSGLKISYCFLSQLIILSGYTLRVLLNGFIHLLMFLGLHLPYYSPHLLCCLSISTIFTLLIPLDFMISYSYFVLPIFSASSLSIFIVFILNPWWPIRSNDSASCSTHIRSIHCHYVQEYSIYNTVGFFFYINLVQLITFP